jgi:hypothetical protein
MKVRFRDAPYSVSLDDIKVSIDDEMIIRILDTARSDDAYFRNLAMGRDRIKFFRMLQGRELSLSFAIELQKRLGIDIVSQDEVNAAIDSLTASLRQACVLH